MRFEELISLNHLTFFIDEFDQKLVENLSKKIQLSLALMAARPVCHLALRRCETLWSARETASMALSAEQARHTENVFHIALTLIFLFFPENSTPTPCKHQTREIICD